MVQIVATIAAAIRSALRRGLMIASLAAWPDAAGEDQSQQHGADCVVFVDTG
jgi:hypothetical protein